MAHVPAHRDGTWNPEPGSWESREKITNRKRSKKTQRSGQVIKYSSCLCVVVVKSVLCSQGGSRGCHNASRRGQVYAMANWISFLARWGGPPRRARGKLSKRMTRIRGGVNESRRAGKQRTTSNDQRSTTNNVWQMCSDSLCGGAAGGSGK